MRLGFTFPHNFSSISKYLKNKKKMKIIKKRKEKRNTKKGVKDIKRFYQKEIWGLNTAKIRHALTNLRTSGNL